MDTKKYITNLRNVKRNMPNITTYEQIKVNLGYIPIAYYTSLVN